MSSPRSGRNKLQHRFGLVCVTALFAIVGILVVWEDVQKHSNHVGLFSTTVTKMSRKLTIAQRYLKEGQSLIHSSRGKCENSACKSPADGEMIPKTVWMLWNEGFREAPQDKKRIHHSWILYNPTWIVRGLNLVEAEHLTKVRVEGTEGYLPDEVWDSMSIQAKSDYIRIALLHQYGGVWADASLMCNEPLDSWVDRDRDYLFFLRDEHEPDNWLGLYPWYSSWWMAASVKSRAAELIFTQVVDFLRHEGKSEREYFWFHRIVANLWNTDESFVASIGPSESAMGPHCLLGTNSFVDQHMFKRCGRGNIKEPFNLKNEQDWKHTQAGFGVSDTYEEKEYQEKAEFSGVDEQQSDSTEKVAPSDTKQETNTQYATIESLSIRFEEPENKMVTDGKEQQTT